MTVYLACPNLAPCLNWLREVEVLHCMWPPSPTPSSEDKDKKDDDDDKDDDKDSDKAVPAVRKMTASMWQYPDNYRIVEAE